MIVRRCSFISSELGKGDHGHHWFDVSADKIWDKASVESRLLRRLELVLVYVTVVVTNSRRPVGIRGDLSKGYHLRAKIDESLLVSFLNQRC